MVIAATYASVINDFTDRAEDIAAGKQNRFAGPAASILAAVLGITIGGGLVFGWLYRHDLRLLLCYGGIWVAFTIYSFPPWRLKKRGVAGVLCDAAGAHLFPALVAVILTCRGAHSTVGAAWIATVAAWSLAFGLRGIFWHQLTDVENDRAAGVWTFARRHPRAAPIIGTFVIFPFEIAGLAAMFWQIASIWPPVFLVLYVLYAVHSAHRYETSPVIVKPKPQFFIVLHEFYSVLFPIALLIIAAGRDWRDLLVLFVHILLFPRRLFHAVRQIASMTPGLRTVLR